jgi:hypothetical protein
LQDSATATRTAAAVTSQFCALLEETAQHIEYWPISGQHREIFHQFSYLLPNFLIFIFQHPLQLNMSMQQIL